MNTILQIYKSRLQKENFELSALEELIANIQPDSDEDRKLLSTLKKIEKDVKESFPSLYRKYCQDIHFALENGLEKNYEYLAEYQPEGVFEYQIFDDCFKTLKRLVKEHENNLNTVLDLISARDRIEAVRVIFLEAEAAIAPFI